jgi:hypothetical protein
MGTYLLSIGIILAIMLGWVAVERMAQRFALKHPELGPYRERAGGCGGCGCADGSSCRSSAADVE